MNKDQSTLAHFLVKLKTRDMASMPVPSTAVEQARLTKKNETPPSAKSEHVTSSKQKKLSPSLSTPQQIVYIKVGATEETFGLHKELACFHSPYFSKAFKGKFAEAASGELILKDARPDIFGAVVEWLYSQDLYETISETPETEMGTLRLVRLWLLAEYLQIPKLQNETMEFLQERLLDNKISYHQGCQTAYEETTDGSVLRTIFVDALCWSSISTEKIIEYGRTISPEIFVDLFAAGRRRHGRKSTQNPLKKEGSYAVKESSQ